MSASVEAIKRFRISPNGSAHLPTPAIRRRRSFIEETSNFPRSPSSILQPRSIKKSIGRKYTQKAHKCIRVLRTNLSKRFLAGGGRNGGVGPRRKILVPSLNQRL